MKGSKQPFFLYHATRGCHFDNYPSDEWAGKSMSRTVFSDCMVQMDYMLGQLVDRLAADRRARKHSDPAVLRQRPRVRDPAARSHAVRGCKGSSWEGGVRVPTFVYWKGMIDPRKSDGLFDEADILPTMLSLAGVQGAELADLFPKTTYIDGVDQASFLVADNGLSARRSRPYTLNQYFAAVRVDEFKGVLTAEIENGVVQKGDWGGFSGPIFTDSGGGLSSISIRTRRRT